MSKVTMIGVMLFTLLFSVCSIAMGGLVGYWPFDEGSGNVAADASGNGNDGELVGNPTWVAGNFGGALEFDGAASYVNVPHADALSPQTNMTFAAWLKPNVTINAADGAYRLMSKNNDIFFLFNYEQIGQLGFLIKSAAGTNNAVHSTTAEWTAGQWYHVAGTFDGAELKIYVNGVLEATNAFVGETGTSGLDLWIGADDLPSFFPGAIDDIRLYDTALTEVEISVVMDTTSAVQPSGKLVSTWAEIKNSR